MSLKKEEKAITEIAEKYKKTFSNLIKNGKESNLPQLLKDESQPYFSSVNILDYAKENLNFDQRFIIHIHFCLSLMKPQEREIIWKEFFITQTSENKINWWSYHYARSTYYRIRNRAILNFYRLCA